MAEKEKELHLRRLALVLMSQVPDDPEDALKVLGYAQELVEEWLQPREARKTGRHRLHSVAGSVPVADNDHPT